MPTSIWRTLTLISSPRDDFARMDVSCSDQSSLTIADGCVKLGISDVGSGSAGRERGRYTKGVDIELSRANREYMRQPK